MRRSFLGTGWSFPPTFVRGEGVVMVSEEEDIHSSLGILLSTSVGERLMQPRFGCDLRRVVFETLDTTLATYMKDLIETAVLYFEPRILLDDVTFEPRAGTGRLDIHLHYTIARTNTRGNMVYPFHLGEGTEVPP